VDKRLGLAGKIQDRLMSDATELPKIRTYDLLRRRNKSSAKILR